VLDSTHDAKRRSWLETANAAECDFPIQNLPLGVFRTAAGARGGVAIGDSIVDLAAADRGRLFTGHAAAAAAAAAGATLNPLLALGNAYARDLRRQLSEALAESAPAAARDPMRACLVPMSDATLLLPARIDAFTDFLCSLDHTLRMGNGNVPQAFKVLPIAYNGRASSVCVSGQPVRRPNGHSRTGDGAPSFGPEPWLDFELELGAFIGPGNALGDTIESDDAEQHLFGVCLLNDWSARGIQFFESQPLGPFLGKSFCTSISPWIVTTDALAPFRLAESTSAFDIELEARIQTAVMRARADEPYVVTRTNFRHMYWTFAQMIAHHASNGCNLRSGDLLGSGTASGPEDASRACLAEITARGKSTIALPNGQQRTWLEDGDEVILRGRASRDGYVSIGFGECRGVVEPAR
jgi:fumarylacetoacetase